VNLDLVLIPAGRFRMGSPDHQESPSDNEPQHWVMITHPFYIGKYEVTQEQWEKLMGKNPSTLKGPKYPVEHVNWNDCQQFLKKLNEIELRTSIFPNGHEGAERTGSFRLPTEAEWEWACRAGTRTWFCFGDSVASLGEFAWYRGNSGDITHRVGEKKPNAWGLYDLHGNVWEWCEDWYGEYGSSWVAQRNPNGPDIGQCRTMRGGSLSGFPVQCRSDWRRGCDPAFAPAGCGLRIVMAITKR
jgi:formylglycine-generating enzyme required for sulfatase activity